MSGSLNKNTPSYVFIIQPLVVLVNAIICTIWTYDINIILMKANWQNCYFNDLFA